MDRGRNWKLWLEEAQRHTDGTPFLPLVEIYGDRRVLIEHHRGIVQYGREKICVKVSYGQVTVCGQELKLAKMTKEQLVIFGKIASLCFTRGC